MNKLNWKLLTKKRGSCYPRPPPGKEELAWVTNTGHSRLSGERDAVLVDLSVGPTFEGAGGLDHSRISQVSTSPMRTVNVLGLKFLLDRFPNAKLATASVVAAMQDQIKPEFINSFWEPRFPGQVPSQLALPEVLDGDALVLEGEELNVAELGHTDTSRTTALHVPSLVSR